MTPSVDLTPHTDSPIQPESISFANNNFTTLSSLHLLPKFLPQLKNISFQNNELRMWKDLEAIIPHDPKHKEAVSSIREIILMGNPVHDQEVAKGDLTVYRRCAHATVVDFHRLNPRSVVDLLCVNRMERFGLLLL
jgi:nuclear RNA export factor